MAISTTTVEAQDFNFSTRGYFSSAFGTCNQGAGGAALSVTCTGGGFTLNYTGVNTFPGNYLSGSNVSLGTFTISGTGDVTVPGSTVNFTLLVDNTVPSSGTGNFSGFITGQIRVGQAGLSNFSSLIWSPNPTTVADGVTYSLILDAVTGGVNIPVNGNVDIRARGVVSTIPEPSTYALLGSGLLGLAGLARRRRTTV
ncbi:hypothetical protein rosag_20120 [Roseisolibacter agri]|uniref:Ice-binding protein C-terminal domain-containing protein n=2 Tax=Roseisolibacter agri TaxID=2014610 RepID=A0AA37VEN7_9BACT|nr:hypothetical protein rosag_20120 [Roseisolibacter agri]